MTAGHALIQRGFSNTLRSFSLVEEEDQLGDLEVKADGTFTVRFVQWNVHYTNKNTQGLASELLSAAPDVVGLCELLAPPDKMAAHLSSTFGRTYKLQPGRAGWQGYGTDIFYDDTKLKALEGGVEKVLCPGTLGGERAANWAVLQHRATSKIIVTGGIHLSYCANGCDSTHECELKKLYNNLKAMKSKYPGSAVAWMGDLNRGPNTLIVQNLLQGKIGSEETFGVVDLAKTEGNTYFGGGPPIDHILGEPGAFTRKSGGRIPGKGVTGQLLVGADHFPVFAEFAYTGAASSSHSPVSPQSPPSTAGQNHYRKVAGVGGWGGTCTCPDGSVFKVGDNSNGCGSLACEGGIAGVCMKKVDAAWTGMKVTCAEAAASPPSTTGQNHYRKADGVGGWGGTCTCPDGSVFKVGDNHNGCGSLACEGGTAGVCMKEVDAAWAGMKVTCAEAAASPPSTTGQNHYRKADGVGGWGGTCTCPDGSVFKVGDNRNGCGSLACEGGIAGVCMKEVDAAWAGMKVTCAEAAASPPSTIGQNHYRKADGVGGWGGTCTCPDGSVFKVGDNHNGCGSLACEGGIAGVCMKKVNAAWAGMKVTCADA